MKRVVIFVLLLLLGVAPVSNAAPKKIAVKPLQFLTSVGIPKEVSGVVASGKNLIVYGTQESKAYVRSVASTGNEIWKISLDQSSTSIATTAAVDAAGNIWIAGARPAPAQVVSPAPTPINPDNALTPLTTFAGDLNSIAIWKVSTDGALLLTNFLPTNFVVLPTALAVDTTGLSIVGLVANEKVSAGFLINTDNEGVFSNLLQIGATSTTADAVVRHRDGSFTVAGSSAETIAAKKVAGLRDGILVKISAPLKITSIVRSSIAKGERIWNSASSSLLLGGEVNASGKIEVAVTKFSTSFVPKWSYRFAATGGAWTVGATQLFFISTATLPQLVWKPKSPTPLLLTFDSKGVITAADSGPAGQEEVLGAFISKELGVLVLTSSAESVSVFTRIPR